MHIRKLKNTINKLDIATNSLIVIIGMLTAITSNMYLLFFMIIPIIMATAMCVLQKKLISLNA